MNIISVVGISLLLTPLFACEDSSKTKRKMRAPQVQGSVESTTNDPTKPGNEDPSKIQPNEAFKWDGLSDQPSEKTKIVL